MTDRERLDILWNDHHAHIDEHRAIGREFDELRVRINKLENLVKNLQQLVKEIRNLNALL